MKTFASMLVALALLVLGSGCCCSHGYGNPCYYGGGCPGGACGVGGAPGPIYGPTGSYAAPGGAYQAAVPGTMASPVAVAPQPHFAGYPQTALAPLESLPTY